jgi:hypothetical protein
MLYELVFISLGFLAGCTCVTYFVLAIKNRDDLLIRDLLDRLISDSPGDYLNLVYQRENLGLEKDIPWFKNFNFNPLTKKKIVLPAEVPSVGNLEMDRAKKKAADEAKKQMDAVDEFEKQQADRFKAGEDLVIP